MQREVLRELAQLVRYAEPDGTNIGPFVAERASELAHLLQSDAGELRVAAHERDGVLVDRLRMRLELAVERERRLRSEHEIERSLRAARELARTARWSELGLVLDVDVVLGDLLANPRMRLVSFVLDAATVALPIAMLRRVRPLLREHIDLACFVDERGIHFRWKAGRGQLNFYAAQCRAADSVLVVQLLSRVERRPVLLGDVLVELGFGL